jgi:hypothetical protein
VQVSGRKQNSLIDTVSSVFQVLFGEGILVNGIPEKAVFFFYVFI